MSAIFGIYNLDGKTVSSRLLDEMSAILSHRGMDGADIWFEDAVGLGNRIFKTNPESENEKLPFANADKSLVITADARLDNREELIKNLGLYSTSYSVITDSELILGAYERWSDGCAEYLLGDFAFAIWDLRRQQLFCARDHFGVKSIYYYASQKIFAFATEIKGLLSIPEVPKRINEIRVANHLKSVFEDKEHTFYQDILRLQPGHCITVDRERIKSIKYWNLKLPPELKLNSDEEYAEGLREHFTEAVRCRLRSSVPVGTMLSGGIDSSSITCVARRLLAEDGGKNHLHTFSAVFDQVKECDERRYMNTVLREKSIKPHFVIADNYGPFVDADEVLKFQDEPVYSGNLYIQWLSYKAAQAQGIKVILDGFDGDNTISHGLGFFIELANEKRWAKLSSEVIAFSKKREVPWGAALWSWFWFYGLNPWISRNRFRRRTRDGVRRIKRIIGADKNLASGSHSFSYDMKLNPKFAERVKLAEPEKKKVARPRTERESHLQNLDANGNPFTLEVLGRASSACSVEARFPFWDKRLIEFCLSLPAEQKIKKGWTRMVMRRAMADILPPEIQWRPGKTDMTPSFNYGFLKFGRELMNRFIINEPETIVDYVDIKALRESHHRFLNSEASEIDVLSIQRSVSLALWLQKIS